VIIDAPAVPGQLIEAARGTEVQAVLLTHGHGDHVAGLREILAAFDVPVGIAGADAGQISLLGVTPSIDVSDGAVITAGDVRLTAMHTPGHTAGSTGFLLPASGNRAAILFGGDTLFPGGPGGTRSPEDFTEIVASINERLLTLPADTEVWPGHGDTTTIGEASREYQAFAARPHEAGLHGTVTWE